MSGTKQSGTGNRAANVKNSRQGHKPSQTLNQSQRGSATKAVPPAKQGKSDAKPKRQLTAREVALETLVRVAESGAYSNLQLNRALQDAGLSRPDAGLATELVYGTIQRQRTIDDILMRLVTKGWSKLAPWVLQLLRMSAYQICYLDRVPPHAAVNEAVTIAKRRGHSGISGMVNGVLRNLLRRKEELMRPAESGGAATDIGIRQSYPDWIVSRWIDAYGVQTTEAICAAGNEPPHASIRVNTVKGSREHALRELAEQGFEAEPSKLAPAGIVVRGGGNLALTNGYTSGSWTMQDESSMLVAEVCAPRPGTRVLDCCAAPGGKTTHLAELMGDAGEVIANDVHEHKRKLIEEQANRLGLRSVQPVTGDAGRLTEQYKLASFETVLLDAPCSGLGVIRRKPEIKWTKSPGDVGEIAGVQRRLLREAAQLVKPGGSLVYSTCTIAREENEDQVAAFLAEQPEFEFDPDWPADVMSSLREAGVIADDFRGELQLLPQHFGSDGFYIAKLRRKQA
ncbi:16S rRNA (cytosine(967)-C(5))-methyltransferase RsmB [Paenibacillus methanolicus]|uniref:16S rRNA (cytosine(967)-C(5))-methyltransferase n=1 Tax=Paenibacillus methanolicus TaxID=582686 RepID=A0A5S5C2V3_9BACL|nr:16S rRNA (cytosine(967)-C(5))-methyltransferase RsmB [Paenibacillus methanolicus]TYP72660.1 16S rRNA (cytosine967-C5)-methyltransferase [Paenibacillus methanolicus]